MSSTEWEKDYSNLCEIPGHGKCGICEFLFTCAIVSDLNPWGYEDRWCFHSHEAAAKALEEWKERPDMAEPEGWHRHPKSGRRRPYGDKTKEFVAR